MTNIKQIIAKAILISLPVAAHADIAVIVKKGSDSFNDANNEKAVRSIFLGKTTVNSAGKSIVTFDQKESSDIRERFGEIVLKKSNYQLTSHWSRMLFTGKARPPREISGGDSSVIKAIAQNDNAIGYIDAANLDSSVEALIIIKE